MNIFQKSNEFDAWLVGLKDHVGKAHIALRLDRAAKGNFGDCEPVGEGVFEMRIHYGPGYRVYFTRRDSATQWFTCCCWAVTNRPKNVTSSKP